MARGRAQSRRPVRTFARSHSRTTMHGADEGPGGRPGRRHASRKRRENASRGGRGEAPRCGDGPGPRCCGTVRRQRETPACRMPDGAGPRLYQDAASHVRTVARPHVRTHARVPVGRPSRGARRHVGQHACRQARPRHASRFVRQAVGDCGRQKAGRARCGTCQESGDGAGCRTCKTARGGQAGISADLARIAHPHVRTFARAAVPEDRQSAAGRYLLGSRTLADQAGRPSDNGARRRRARNGSGDRVSGSCGNQVMRADPSATIVTERHVPAGVTTLPTGRQREQDAVALSDAGAGQRMRLKGAEAPGLADKPADQQRTKAKALGVQPFAQSHNRTVARAPAKPTCCNATKTGGNAARGAPPAPERREPKDSATPPGGRGKPRRRGAPGGKVPVEEGECPGWGRCDGPARRRRLLPAVGGHRPVSDTPGTVHRAHACRRHARMPIIARDERLCGDRDERLRGGAAAREDAGRTTAAAATARTPPGNQGLSPIHFHQGDHQ